MAKEVERVCPKRSSMYLQFVEIISPDGATCLMAEIRKVGGEDGSKEEQYGKKGQREEE